MRVHFASDVKQDSDIADEADAHALDYTSFRTLQTIVKVGTPPHHRSNADDLKEQLFIVNHQLKRFCLQHGKLPELLEFRLQLLRFAQIFHRARLDTQTAADPSPALTGLRQSNRERAAAWWTKRRASYSQPSPDEPDTADALACALNQAEKDTSSDTNEAMDEGRSATASTDNENEGAEASLLDLLPLFVELGSDRARSLGRFTTERWLQLAVEFMVQAFLEQRVRYNAKGCSALLEAFAWGPLTAPESGSAEVDETERVHDVFLLHNDAKDSDSDAESESSGSSTSDDPTPDQFLYLRDRAIHDLDPATHAADSSTFYQSLLDSTQPLAAHPHAKFETDVWQYIDSLARSVDVPILAQLEESQQGARTRIDYGGQRFSNEQTENLRRIWEVGCYGLAGDG